MQTIETLRLVGLPKYLWKRAHMRFLARPSQRGVRTKMLAGRQVDIDLADLEQYYLYEDCVREPENLFMYRALAASGLCETFVDVGANYGHVALSVADVYKRLIIIDANPKAFAFLKKLFDGEPKATLINAALVGDPTLKSVQLRVPKGSSGLGSIVHGSGSAEESDVYDCPTMTLNAILSGSDVGRAYVKIDVEGAEEDVIIGGLEAINRLDTIVGYEALSAEQAIKCARHFTDHVFYFARFAFLEQGGALTRSIGALAGAVVAGGDIAVYKTDDLASTGLGNFSQIVAVRRGRVVEFEQALKGYAASVDHKIRLS